MRTGRLSISRGHRYGGPAAPAPRLSIVGTAEPAPRIAVESQAAVASEYKPVYDRLGALERLARLRDSGVLDEAEFAAEKAAILNPQAGELVLNEPLLVPERPRSPSLLGRLFGWKLVPIGIAAGLALSYASQPNETLRFLEETLRLLGA
jgi:hypothetical protein